MPRTKQYSAANRYNGNYQDDEFCLRQVDFPEWSKRVKAFSCIAGWDSFILQKFQAN